MYLTIIGIPVISSIIGGIYGNRIGRKGIDYILVYPMMISAVLGGIGVYEIGIRGNEAEIRICEYIGVEMVDSMLGMKVDSLSITMVGLITLIGMMVLLYSSEYMSEDRGYERYMVYINIFIGGMLMMVMSDNMIGMFIGYEVIGIVSYLLISYWNRTVEGQRSAIQAVLVNKVGDVAIIIGICMIYNEYRSVSYNVIYSMAERSEGVVVIMISIMLLIGAVSKSGQIGLHIWLPNAMMAPTPISALLHAATMVTAGVYVIVRMSPVIEESRLVLDIIVVIAGGTIILGGVIGAVQNDMKRIIAYSTMSQLGYMMLGCGYSSYKVSMYHLVNHGYFKALLFLSAGVIIHGMRDEQDIRRLGGLRGLMPVAYISILIGTVALLGLPFLAGYYSKDIILEVAVSKALRGELIGIYGYMIGMIGVFMTAYYSTRLIRVVFIEKVVGRRVVIEGVSEGGYKMRIPLIILSILSIIAGYIMKEVYVGIGNNYWKNSIYIKGESDLLIEGEMLSNIIKLMPIVITVLGVIVGMRLENSRSYEIVREGIMKEVYNYVVKRCYFDKVYNEVIVQEVISESYKSSHKIIDRGILEVTGGLGVGVLMNRLGELGRLIQSGSRYNYMLMMVIGVVGILLSI